MKKFLHVMLVLLGCAAMACGGYLLAVHKMTENVEPPAPPVAADTPVVTGPAVSGPSVGPVSDEDEDPNADPDITDITFAACGDNLINSYIYNQAKARGKNGKYDFSFCYDKVKDFFMNTDLNWINQETLVTDTIKPSTFPRFSSPGDVARALYDDNFRVFSLANNHSYDQKDEGLSETVKFWKSMPDDVVTSGISGVKNDSYKKISIKTVNDVKFAFLSYTYGTNGMSVSGSSKYRVIYLNQTDTIKKQIKLARKKADVVIVSCHWGDEDRHYVTDSQRSMAKKLAKWGADLIIGTHPHVVQTAEWIKTGGRKTFCVYSLGNFISGQSKADNLIGTVLSLTFRSEEDMLNDTRTVSIVEPKLIPTVTDYKSGYQDICVYWLKDYKKKQADSHGVRSVGGSQFGYDYIYDVLKNNVKNKFLDLPKKKK